MERKAEQGSSTTLPILCMISVVEALDLQLLPASFRAMEISLNLTPVQLSMLVMCQGSALLGSGPFWANLADNGYPRNYMLAFGALVWGMATLALALSSSMVVMMPLRFLNGAALGVLMPVTQSLVAERAVAAERGKTFGMVEFCAKAVGEILAVLAITALSNQVIFGVIGWRMIFLGVACLSILLGLVTLVCLKETRQIPSSRKFNVFSEFIKFRSYCRIATFRVLLLQGMFGMIPWIAMSFSTLYFQYSGFKDLQAGWICAVGKFGCACGGLLGGAIGDQLALWMPHHGRVLTAQISVFISVPVGGALFWVAQSGYATFTVLASLSFLLGCMGSWASSGCNRPILTQIVQPDCWASVLAWHSCAQSTVGGLVGQGGVAFLAEHFFGYHPNSRAISDMPEEARHANARALGSSLVVLTVIPWTLCFLCYSQLHYCYKADLANPEKLKLPPLACGETTLLHRYFVQAM